MPAFELRTIAPLRCYPFLGAAMGWVMGALGSVSYNLVVRMIGGMVLQFDPRDSPAV